EAGRASRPPIDFLVCGVSENPVADQDLRGNFVAVTTFSLGDQRELRAATYSRAKHHRWQLNSAQITSYGLAASLDPNVTWW
ncbi:hypothetical protein, partial [Klebsiella variicola]|uniref:hypothetical protein n=1 Tax=Klebsiella variicola TaxID=244366 RepID=UPI001954B49F